MINFKQTFFSFKQRLLNVNHDEPLSKLSLVVIIALDIFILTVILEGLHDHTRQLTAPYEYVPNTCQEVFIRDNWSEVNLLSRLQKVVLTDYNSSSYRYENQLRDLATDPMHPLCRQMFNQIKQIAEDKTLKDLFIQRQALFKQKSQLTKSFKQSKDVYDTTLLENIANKKSREPGALSSSISEHTSAIEKVTFQITNTEAKLLSSPRVNAFQQTIINDDPSRQQLIKDFKEFQFIYPLKKLGWQMLFMLPLFLVFYLWAGRSVKKAHSIQTLVSTHLLVVVSIPIFLKVADALLDLIPRHFLKDFFNLLESLHIVAIWHYLVIFISVGAALLTIYVIQQKIFNKQRVQQKRLMKGACFQCGSRLPELTSSCPFCGTGLLMECNSCQQQTYRCADFCKQCGASMK